MASAIFTAFANTGDCQRPLADATFLPSNPIEMSLLFLAELGEVVEGISGAAATGALIPYGKAAPTFQVPPGEPQAPETVKVSGPDSAPSESSALRPIFAFAQEHTISESAGAERSGYTKRLKQQDEDSEQAIATPVPVWSTALKPLVPMNWLLPEPPAAAAQTLPAANANNCPEECASARPDKATDALTGREQFPMSDIAVRLVLETAPNPPTGEELEVRGAAEVAPPLTPAGAPPARPMALGGEPERAQPCSVTPPGGKATSVHESNAAPKSAYDARVPAGAGPFEMAMQPATRGQALPSERTVAGRAPSLKPENAYAGDMRAENRSDGDTPPASRFQSALAEPRDTKRAPVEWRPRERETTHELALQSSRHAEAGTPLIPGVPGLEKSVRSGAPTPAQTPIPKQDVVAARRLENRLAEATAEQREPALHSRGTVRELSLRLVQTESRPVDVALTEKAGKIELTVQSGDPTLNRALREDLGELVHQLHREGFEVRTWNHLGTDAPLDAGASHHQDDDSQNARRHPFEPDRDSEGQPHRRRNSPKWDELMQRHMKNEGGHA